MSISLLDDFNKVLRVGIERGASDVHVKVGLPPIFRIDGRLIPLKDAPRYTTEDVTHLAHDIMGDERYRERFREHNDIDLAYGVGGLGRFRVNIFQQRGTLGMVFRLIPPAVKSFEELNLPPVMERIASENRGLVLVTGTTGTGKSTTLAALIEYINQNRTEHIITIEDPIEFLHRDKKSIINQRQIGVDCFEFARALRSALREDPDVILVGEMRDFDTIETAILAAETGHLVFSTLHTLDATETINRIISIFPSYQQRHVRMQLAALIKAVISQRLIPRADGMGRVPAVEVLVSTSRIRECIEDADKTKKITEAISQGYTTYGMQTFDQSIMYLYTKGLITYEEALRQCTNPDDFALKVRGISSTSDAAWTDFDRRAEREREREATVADGPPIERFERS